MDKILIRGLNLFAYHGVNPEEKENGQNFILDIDLNVDMSAACASDCVDDTVNYAKVVKTVRRVFTAEKYDLIEKCADVVAKAILDEYPSVFSVDVLLKKPHAPVSAEFDYMGVQVHRER